MYNARGLQEPNIFSNSNLNPLSLYERINYVFHYGVDGFQLEFPNTSINNSIRNKRISELTVCHASLTN